MKIKKNRHYKLNQLTIGLIVVFLTIFSCRPDEDFPTSPGAATVTTEAITSVTGSSAIGGGQIISDAGFKISTQGICWDTIQDPTFGNSFSLDTVGSSGFINKITGLTGSTTYYVRAFATNNGGISYGENEVFTTKVVPLLTTIIPTDISPNSATSGGVITNSFGAQIVERGVCWSIELNPSIDDSKTTEGSGDNSFTSSVTGLLPSTAYHIRSYATTSEGDTGYGDDVIFDTQISDYDGNIYTSVKIGNYTWMVENYRCTHFTDGTALDYQFHPDDVNKEYGASYSWHVIDNPNFAPDGWHVASDAEWLSLYESIEGDGLRLKESGTDHWNTDNGTNESGFTALGAAHIYGSPLKGDTTWWTSTLLDDMPIRWALFDSGGMWKGNPNGKDFLFSVRLVKNY